MTKVYNIAIDGPAGAGKKHHCRAAASKLILYMWIRERCTVPWHCIFKKRDLSQDEAAISEAVKTADVTLAYENGVQQVILTERMYQD